MLQKAWACLSTTRSQSAYLCTMPPTIYVIVPPLGNNSNTNDLITKLMEHMAKNVTAATTATAARMKRLCKFGFAF